MASEVSDISTKGLTSLHLSWPFPLRLWSRQDKGGRDGVGYTWSFNQERVSRGCQETSAYISLVSTGGMAKPI